jgi:hypothetical protein
MSKSLFANKESDPSKSLFQQGTSDNWLDSLFLES